MNPGDLVFISGTGCTARLIKWITKSKYSHVAIYMGQGQLIEAQAFRTVGFQSLAAYEGEYDVVPLPASVSAEDKQKAFQWLLAQRGRNYSYWSDFVILVKRLFGVNIPWHEGLAIMCSRLARDFCFQCGLPIPDADMSPEDLFEWLENYGLAESPRADTIGAR